jgi:hypothetical protein
MRRVVQFSTGNVGQHALKAIIGRPDLELVGLHASSPNKIGRDAAELCGLTEPTGIIATDDVDALIALKPDCVVYTAQAETRPMEALEQLTKLLAAGINVVGSSMVWLVAPRQADDWLLGPLGDACVQGNSSLYVNGIDPGYSGDTEVHTALSLVTRAESILVQEIFDYANYDDFEFTGKSMGFGLTADEEQPMFFLPGVLTMMWGGPIRNLADQLGIELDEVRQRIEPWYTDKTIECKMCTVEPGGMAAVRFAVEGVSNGAPCGDRGRTSRRTQHARFRSGARCHRGRMCLHRGPRGQRDRLGVRSSCGTDCGRRHSTVRGHPRPDVVTASVIGVSPEISSTV